MSSRKFVYVQGVPTDRPAGQPADQPAERTSVADDVLRPALVSLTGMFESKGGGGGALHGSGYDTAGVFNTFQTGFVSGRGGWGGDLRRNMAQATETQTKHLSFQAREGGGG